MSERQHDWSAYRAAIRAAVGGCVCETCDRRFRDERARQDHECAETVYHGVTDDCRAYHQTPMCSRLPDEYDSVRYTTAEADGLTACAFCRWAARWRGTYAGGESA